jgi:hypothetical protein
MDEVIYSASGPPSCMVSMDVVIYSAPAIVPAALSTSPSSGFEMDQDSYSKLMASSHERHLKRTKNLQLQKWQQQQQRKQQLRRKRQQQLAAASPNKSCYSLD